MTQYLSLRCLITFSICVLLLLLLEQCQVVETLGTEFNQAVISRQSQKTKQPSTGNENLKFKFYLFFKRTRHSVQQPVLQECDWTPLQPGAGLHLSALRVTCQAEAAPRSLPLGIISGGKLNQSSPRSFSRGTMGQPQNSFAGPCEHSLNIIILPCSKIWSCCEHVCLFAEALLETLEKCRSEWFIWLLLRCFFSQSDDISCDDMVTVSTHTAKGITEFCFNSSRICIYGWSDVSVPFVPGRRQTSEIQVPLQTQTGLWRRARLGCGSELWSRLQTMSLLQRVKQSWALCLEGSAHMLWSAIQWWGPSPVSPQTGRYSSCWMSSMSSRPLPIPPLVVRRGGQSSSAALNV